MLRYDSWLFVRITGALLIGLVGLHLLGSFFFRSWFAQFDSPIYRVGRYLVDGAMLALAITHGAGGLYRIVEEQGIPRRSRAALRWLLVLGAIALSIGGLLSLGRLAS